MTNNHHTQQQQNHNQQGGINMKNQTIQTIINNQNNVQGVVRMKHIKQMTVKELYNVARTAGIRGRSKMNKEELMESVLLKGIVGVSQDGTTIIYEKQNTEGGDIQMTRQQKRASERELLKTMGQFVQALTKFDPQLAEQILGEIKKGRPVRKAFSIVEQRSSELWSKAAHFLNRYDVPRRFRPSKRAQVVVRHVSLENMEFRDGKLYATERFKDMTDYSKGSGYMRTSISDLHEKAGIEIKSVEGLALNVSTHIVVVDIGEYDANNPEKKEHAEKIDHLMKHGFYFVEGGKEKHCIYALRSNSQARQLKGMFLVNDGKYTIPSFLRRLGHEPIVYAKYKDGVYVLDATKPDKRKGLSGTSSFQLMSFSFGRKVRYDDEDVVIEGGPFTMRIVEDVHAVIREGKFKAIDKDNKQIVTLNAADHPQKVVVGDGQCFVNARVAHIIHQEAGVFGATFQHRTGAMIKGMFIAVPDLDQYYKEDFVVFAGAAKGNIVEYLKAGHNIEIRVARINPPAKKAKEFTMFPYQFVHILNLSAEDMIKIIKPHLDKIKDLLHNPEAIKSYLGLIGGEELEEEQLETRLATLLMKAIYYSDGMAYHDAYLKRSAMKLISMMIRRWVTGQIPVAGHYKYLVQDPKAILEALKMNQRDEDGDIIVPDHVGLRPGQVVVAVHDQEAGHEVCHQGKVALFRNPAITQGEAAAVEAIYDEYYAASLKGGFYSNLVIVSCHDFTLIRQGGADVDGDTSLVVFEPIIVERAHAMNVPAVLDRYFERDEKGEFIWGDGCPWNPSSDEFTVKFTPEEYTDRLIEQIHELERKWVIRTLQQNKIGYLTNCATILADKKRQLVYAIRENMDLDGQPLTKERNRYVKLAQDFQNKIDWIRYAQGWEIDRAKHGGAYEEHLSDELAFVMDQTQLPEMCSLDDPKTGARRWLKPLWFEAFNKAKTMDDLEKFEHRKSKDVVLSVLDRFFLYMMSWWKNFKGDFEAYYKEARKHNLIGLLSSLNIDKETFMAIYNELLPISKEYNYAIRNIQQMKETALKQPDYSYGLLDILEAIEESAKEQIIAVAEQLKHKVAQSEIIEKHDPAVVGYVAYMISYSDVSRNSTYAPLSFPWVIMEEYVLAAIRKAIQLAKDKEAKSSNKKQVIHSAFVVRAYVPEHLTKEQVAQMIAATKEHGVYAIRRKSPNGVYKYYLYVMNPMTSKYEPMGIFFDSMTEKYFAGHEQVKMNVETVYVSGKHVVNVSGSRMIKL
jgi:hypothetical protein